MINHLKCRWGVVYYRRVTFGHTSLNDPFEFFWSRNPRDLISDGSKRGILACAAAAKPQGNHAEFDVAVDDFASGLY